MRIDDFAKNAMTIGISGHEKPDGDCIGSCLAMYQYLTKSYPEARVDVFLQKPADVYSFLKGFEQIHTDFKTDVQQYDLFIVLDSGKDRISDAEVLFDQAKHTINIDHHISNSGSGEENYIVPSASSACELVYEVIDREKIDMDIAKALYTGIVTDTGVFKYSNTSPKTMEIGADLISFGFEQGQIINEVFYGKTYVQQQILGRALLEATLFCDGRCIFSYISKQTMDFYNADSNDLDGIASQLMLTKGVHCAIFLYEIGQQEYKVSLRSDGVVNVAEVAGMFGGGGHARAAGVKMSGTVYDVLNNLSLYIAQQLDKTEV